VEACFEDTSFAAVMTSIGDALASQLNLKQRIKLTKTESRETHKQTISGGTALKHTHTHTHTHEATSEVPWVRAHGPHTHSALPPTPWLTAWRGNGTHSALPPTPWRTHCPLTPRPRVRCR
jgi:hypothetical protein